MHPLQCLSELWALRGADKQDRPIKASFENLQNVHSAPCQLKSCCPQSPQAHAEALAMPIKVWCVASLCLTPSRLPFLNQWEPTSPLPPLQILFKHQSIFSCLQVLTASPTSSESCTTHFKPKAEVFLRNSLPSLPCSSWQATSSAARITLAPAGKQPNEPGFLPPGGGRSFQLPGWLGLPRGIFLMLKQTLWREGGATNRAKAGSCLSKAASRSAPPGTRQGPLGWPQSCSHCPSASGFTGDGLKLFLHM